MSATAPTPTSNERSRLRPADTRPGKTQGRRRAAPARRSWQERLDDPDEPLYTMAVAADLLGLDNQTLRRLGTTISQNSARPSGNQRRYSRHDLQALADAAELTKQSYAGPAIAASSNWNDRYKRSQAPPPPPQAKAGSGLDPPTFHGVGPMSADVPFGVPQTSEPWSMQTRVARRAPLVGMARE